MIINRKYKFDKRIGIRKKILRRKIAWPFPATAKPPAHHSISIPCMDGIAHVPLHSAHVRILGPVWTVGLSSPQTMSMRDCDCYCCDARLPQPPLRNARFEFVRQELEVRPVALNLKLTFCFLFKIKLILKHVK